MCFSNWPILSEWSNTLVSSRPLFILSIFLIATESLASLSPPSVKETQINIQMVNGWSCYGTRFCIRWKIDVLNGMSIFLWIFFFFLAQYTLASAQPTRNSTYISFTKHFHTNVQRKVIVTSCTPVEWYETARLCNGTIWFTLSSHRLVHNKLTRCCTMRDSEHHESFLLFTTSMTHLQNIVGGGESSKEIRAGILKRLLTLVSD